MQLTLTDLRALPLAAAVVERDWEVVAQTPEWQRPGAGTVMYPVRSKTLLVNTRDADATSRAVLDEILELLDAAAAASHGDLALRVRMLAASLRLLSGCYRTHEGTAAEVLELATAGIKGRSSLAVEGTAARDIPVQAPEAVALVLVQLAVNAQCHAGAERVQLAESRGAFHVTWASGWSLSPVRTARRHASRRRWGLGFARIAADALGGVVHPPYANGDNVTSTLELGIGRLTLPLAVVRHETVVRSTRAFEEETGLLPGAHVQSAARLAETVAAARGATGQIACSGSWSARAVGDEVWVAVAPDDVSERLLDVLDGIAHEHELLHGLPERLHVRLHALALALGVCLGRPMPRVPARAWSRRMQTLAYMLPQSVSVPAFDGMGAVEPDLVTALAERAGSQLHVSDGCLYLEVRDDASDDTLVRALLPHGDHRVRLG